jgi:hypothetical protein
LVALRIRTYEQGLAADLTDKAYEEAMAAITTSEEYEDEYMTLQSVEICNGLLVCDCVEHAKRARCECQAAATELNGNKGFLKAKLQALPVNEAQVGGKKSNAGKAMDPAKKYENRMAVAQVARRMVCKKQSKQLMLSQRQ